VTDVKLGKAENSDFPILCETCLGDNPYVRMIRGEEDKECKICARPYTGFRWRPGGQQSRYKNTIVCQSCARLKNVCQTCLFDMEYGLPVEVRDKYLEEAQKVQLPALGPNRDFYTSQFEAQGQALQAYGKAAAHPMLSKLARTTPYYKRNRTKVCSFWQKGECTRGESCPFFHGDPDHDPGLADQNIRDRFSGENDPVAKKMMRRADDRMNLTAPEDRSITSLFLSGLPDKCGESMIRDKFYPFGEILSIKMMPTSQCAIVTYATRKSAEAAASQLFKRLTINDAQVRLAWGRGGTEGGGASSSSRAVDPDGPKPLTSGAPSASQMPAYIPPPVPSMMQQPMQQFPHPARGAQFPPPGPGMGMGMGGMGRPPPMMPFMPPPPIPHHARGRGRGPPR